MNRPLLYLFCASAVTASSACAPHLATRASRSATPVVIDETLKSLEDPRTQDRITGIVASPQMEAAMGDLAASFMRGALTDSETTAHVQALTAALTQAIVEAVHAEALRLGPELRAALRRTVTEMVAAATHEATLQLSEDLPNRLAPAVRSSVATELVAPDLQNALESTSRGIARQVVAGSHEALFADRDQLESPGVLYRASRLIRVATWALLFAMLSGAIVLTTWIRKLRRQAKAPVMVNTSRKGRSAPRSRTGSSRLRSSRW